MEEKKLNLLRRIEHGVFATDNGRFDAFTRVEREKLVQFWATLEGASINWPAHLAEQDRECLVMRYLRSNDLNVKKAIASLKRASQLREDYHIDDLNIAQIGEAVRKLGYLPLGLTKMGSPAFTVSIVDVDLGRLEVLSSVLAWVYLCEYIDRTYPRNMAPLTCLVDCKGKPLGPLLRPLLRHPSTLLLLKTRTLKLTRELYPRRLNMTIVYMQPHGLLKPMAKLAPMLFSKMLKYHSVVSDSFDAFDLLFEDENAIPVRYGGKREWDVNRFIDERRQAEAPEHDDTPLEDFHRVEPTVLHRYPKAGRDQFEQAAADMLGSPEHEAAVSPTA
ncbi:CRAL-TRIO lipid binding domain [Carpediemonas membranifera]|uniref:CRAL-TRIO lipid binding domain n=1 Tax=Carpediemonas membranifera TaxID=201153 RepID=A0A8J6AXS7_9EUKA|nr:CRAL-TRIO lipid binding domain [Carpediemonas membranifera]|eukprot:KAG9395105.1 CRAL-TRIO lipid binding domain [Carpediemonas membranifera]